ncbi:MAG: DUF2384 domain-containing protein [Cellvibrionaceae bacterium]
MATSQGVFSPSTHQTASGRAMKTVSKLAGVPLKTTLDEVRLTQNGISPTAIESLKSIGATMTELQWVIKPRTLAHRKSKSQCLTPDETGRWLRAAKVQALALEVFGSQEKAYGWLHKPRKSFDGQTAMDIIQSEAGAQLVEETLNQIDAGFFA